MKIRKKIPPSPGCSVKTYNEKDILSREEFFLFPGNDQVLLCFQLKGTNVDNVTFIQTDKLGNNEKEFPVKSFDLIIIDYSATIQNFFNFDANIAKRVIIESPTLVDIWMEIQKFNIEREFEIDRIRNVE